MDNAVIINNSKQISFEETTAVIIEDVDIFNSKAKNIRFLQANKVQTQIKDEINNEKQL